MTSSTQELMNHNITKKKEEEEEEENKLKCK